jgi:hypothetical protein
MKSSFHNLILILPLFCNCQFRRHDAVPELISWQAGVSKLDSTRLQLKSSLEPLCTDHAENTAPLHSNGIYSTFACLFVATGICLLSRCLAMNNYSDFTIPAFGRHVTTPSWEPLCYVTPWRLKRQHPLKRYYQNIRVRCCIHRR